MSTFTPTSKSQIIAGFTFWLVIWSLIIKLDKVAQLFRVDKWITSKRVLDWIAANKVLALVCSEFINMLIHDVSTASGTCMLIGGTACNTLMIFVVLPIARMCGHSKQQPVMYRRGD